MPLSIAARVGTVKNNDPTLSDRYCRVGCRAGHRSAARLHHVAQLPGVGTRDDIDEGDDAGRRFFCARWRTGRMSSAARYTRLSSQAVAPHDEVARMGEIVGGVGAFLDRRSSCRRG
jgi:hypothetical protein